jgi:hypothetical protein
MKPSSINGLRDETAERPSACAAIDPEAIADLTRLVPGARLVALAVTVTAGAGPRAQDPPAADPRGEKSATSAGAGIPPTHFTPCNPGRAGNFSARLIPRFPHRFVENFGGERLEAAP